ncbi:MAG: 4Fe-4S binding protein [Spirochaetes bacterium]|nr:4Fe-4S binding protein [Spirochaetota bacterium]
MAVAVKHLLKVRRAVQCLSVFLLVYMIWNTRFPLSGFINPEFYFLIDPFAMIVTSVAERVLLSGLVYSAIVLAGTIILGRAFCGWICPLGALLDFLSWLRSLILGLFRKKEREPAPLRLRYVKYAILSAVFALAVAGIQAAWPIDPITIFVRTFSFTIHPFVSGSVDSGMVKLLEASGYPEWLESLYSWLREWFLSLSTPRFTHSETIVLFFVGILILSLVRRRFWCRHLCPLGAILALVSRRPLLRRDSDACETNCGVCRDLCRMNAIKPDNSYLPEECVVCLDCAALCPAGKSSFVFKKPWGQSNLLGVRSKAGCQSNIQGSEQQPWGQSKTAHKGEKGLHSRQQFIIMLWGLLTSIPAFAARPEARTPRRTGTQSGLRPPGALPEEEFIQRCIRCGNCMKVCPTNVLQPAPLRRGPAGAWAPVMDVRLGYCEYNCNLCGSVCPTGAIRPLTLKQKQQFKIGIAIFDPNTCLPYAKGEDCLVCEEHCPVPDKAIKFRRAIVKGKIVKLPYVVAGLCIGCAICECRCPVEPDRGIITIRTGDA